MRDASPKRARRRHSWLRVLRERWERYGPFALSATAHFAFLIVLTHIVTVSFNQHKDVPLNISLVSINQAEEASDAGENAPEPEPAAEPEPQPLVAPGTTGSQQDDASDASALPPGLPVISVNAPGGHAGDIFGNRGSGRRWGAVGRGGGGVSTESAVHAALRWLAQYQSPDGSWDAAQFASQAGVALPPEELGAGYDDPLLSPGLSGLALLAFLASDSTHKDGEFRDTVERGIRYLRSLQRPDGRFTARLTPGPDPHLMYGQALCTLALAEASGMSGDTSLKPALEKSIQFIARAQQAGGGWDYGPEPTQRNDTSITGWVVMALKSAQAAGVQVPWIVIFNAIRHFDSSTLDSGEVAYANNGVGTGRRGLSMIAVGIASRQFLGWPSDAKILQRQARMISRYRIAWDRVSTHDAEQLMDSSYYWYYGTIALFQFGGEPWRQWNEAMTKELLAHQVREGPMRGSWDPVGLWANVGGRVYSTALNALDLEIYYRYLPLYETEALDGAGALVRAAQSSNAAQRFVALRILRDFNQPVAIAGLAEAIGDESEDIRLAASLSLASQLNRLALPALVKLTQSDNSFVRFQALQALDGYNLEALAPRYISMLNDSERFVRSVASKRLERWAGSLFDYNLDAKAEERAPAIRRFRQWWDGTKDGKGSQLETTVVAVDPKRSLAFVAGGRNQGVSANDLLAVMRDGKFVALLSAQETFADKTVAAILPDYAKGEVREGDAVIPSSPPKRGP